MGINPFALLAAALWLYALFLALTRTKSPTAKGVAVASLLLLAGISLKDLAVPPQTGGYPFESQEDHELGEVDAVEIYLMNAEIKVAPGPGRLELVKKAKSPRALLGVRPRVETRGPRLKIHDPKQPKGSLYQLTLTLPNPAALTVRVSNGIFEAQDTLRALDFSATNASLKLARFAPQAPSRIAITNGEVRLSGYAPRAPLKITLTNGTVEVHARGPVHYRVDLTNGQIRYPEGTASGRGPFEWGDPEAPELWISATNGEVVIEEERP